jgi:hypothetical protein
MVAALSRPPSVPDIDQRLGGIVEQVFPIEQRDDLGAREIVMVSQERSARDAVHLAVMQRHRIEKTRASGSSPTGTRG